jgi:hypothetical protein
MVLNQWTPSTTIGFGCNLFPFFFLFLFLGRVGYTVFRIKKDFFQVSYHEHV